MSHAPHSCSRAKREENIAKMVSNRNENGGFEKKKKKKGSAKNREGRDRPGQRFNIADYMPRWALEAMEQSEYDDDELAEIADNANVGCIVQ